MKHFFRELISSFFLGLAIISFEQNPLGIGCIYLALIYMNIGCMFGYANPAISLLLFMRKLINGRQLGVLMLAQVLGMLGATVGMLIAFGELPCPTVSPEISLRVAGAIEALLTALLGTIILVVIQRRYTELSGIIIGLAVVGLASFGGIFNPAVAAASSITSIVHGGGVCVVKDLLVYFGAPFVGSVIALGLYALCAD